MLIREVMRSSIWGVAGFVVAVIAAYFAYKQIRPDLPELTLEIRSVVTPTSIPSVPDLEGKFFFRGKAVEHLTVLSIQIVNSGTVTIVGSGPKQNTVRDALRLGLIGSSKILDVEFALNEVDAKLRSPTGGAPELLFEQWRPQERLDLTLYVDGPTTTPHFDAPQLQRQIVDGTFSVVTSAHSANESTLSKVLGIKLIQIARRLGPLVGALIFGLTIFLLIRMLQFEIARRNWIDSYFPQLLVEMREKYPGISEDEVRDLVYKPRNFLTKTLGLKTRLEHLIEPPEPQAFFGLLIFGLLVVVAMIWALDSLLILSK